MDINAAIERMRQLDKAILPLTGIPADDLTDSDIRKLQDDAASLAIVWEAIDGWLGKGGFLPSAWSANRS